MDKKEIEAELLVKQHKQTAILDHSTEKLDTLIKDTKKVESELNSAQTQLDQLNAHLIICDTKIKMLKSTRAEKHKSIHSLESDLRSLNSELFDSLTKITEEYNNALITPLKEIKTTCDSIAGNVFQTVTITSKEQLMDIVNDSSNGIIVVNPHNGNPFTIDISTGAYLLNTNSKTATSTKKTVNDRGCTTQPDTYTTEYKLLEQSWSDSKSEYHLILKMPSKYTDFVSRKNPSTEQMLDTTKTICPVSRWNTTGKISNKHKLNDAKIPCTIKELEIGTVDIISDMKSYEMTANFKGILMNGNSKFTKQSSHTNEWSMDRRI